MTRSNVALRVPRPPFDRSVLVRQFALGRSPRVLPAGWQGDSLRDWHLVTHPECGLPIVPIEDERHSQIGWLVGYPVDSHLGLLRDGWSVPRSGRAERLEADLEEAIYSLSGRFAAVVLLDGLERLYLDPFGSLAAVYSSTQEMAGSTTSVFPGGDESGSTATRDPSRDALAASLAIPERDHWYPFGLTNRRDVQRLLPNHYLDLQLWESHRHWPKSGEISRVACRAPVVDALVSRVQTLLEHLVASSSVTMSLTAGRDSRMLAACARPLIDRVQFVTTDYHDRAGRMDRKTASSLARRFGLKHRMVPWRDAGADELDLWPYRTGYALAGRTWEAARTARLEGTRGFSVTGHGGEVGRAFYWREGDLQRDAATVEELVKRLHLPVVDEIVAKGQEWIDQLPADGLPTLLDFLYLEQRMGCWASSMFYGHVAATSTIMPFNRRSIVRDFLSLPPVFRWNGGLTKAVISRRWPEMLDVPFNRFVGLDRILDNCLAPVRRLARNRPRIGRWIPLGEFR